MNLKSLVEPALNSLGYNLIKLELKENKDKILKVFIERKDKQAIKIIDCQRASKKLSFILDVEDAIKESYTLEVSSPGV